MFKWRLWPVDVWRAGGVRGRAPWLPAMLGAATVGSAIFAALLGCDYEMDKRPPDETDQPPAIVQPGPIPSVCPCQTCDGPARTLQFSGYTWTVRRGRSPEPAGRNCYSDHPADVWVDNAGQLHLTIRQRDGVWVATEIGLPGGFGYGTYKFYVASRADSLDRNAVLGFFTWDDTAPGRGTASELDVELTQWGQPDARNLHYTVQPAYGPGITNAVPVRYDERMGSRYYTQTQDRATHLITWAPWQVSFASYEGYGTDPNARVCWSQFDADNPPRVGVDAYFVNPVVIPAVTGSSGVHINLWLTDPDGDGYGNPPTDGRDIEVVVQRFEFTPL